MPIIPASEASELFNANMATQGKKAEDLIDLVDYSIRTLIKSKENRKNIAVSVSVYSPEQLEIAVAKLKEVGYTVQLHGDLLVVSF